MIVDCGHEAVAEGIGTGYATMPDGKRVCYACADASERERMRTADSMFAYVSTDSRSITTWTGGKLATVTAVWTSDRARKTYVQATDVHGTRWYGQGPSETGNYVNLRRAKVSS
jgi:hypothetical protein